MNATLIDLHPESPYRPVDWRYRTAEAILSGQLPPSRRPLDKWVKRAIRFQRDQAGGQGNASIGRSGHLDPAIFGACKIHFSAEPRLRSVLQARVLAGQTVQTIAELCELTADVVEAFERVYYDVRPRLAAADYIRATELGIEPLDGIPDVDALMKTFAFGFGPLVLDRLLAVLDVSELTRDGATSAESANEKVIRMAILARTLPVNSKTAPGLIRLQSRLLEFERGEAADSVINVPIRATIDPWPMPAIGGGSGRPLGAVSVDLGSANLAEPIRVGPGDRPGAITVEFPAAERGDHEAPIRRTA